SNKKTGNRYNSRTSTTAYNTWLDSNNRCHTQSCKAPLHIRPEKLQRRLRKGSTAAMLDCDAWISLSFSSDIPLSSILNFPFLSCSRACDSAGLLVRQAHDTLLSDDFIVQFAPRCPIGCAPGVTSS